jgi:hypothetical protein
MNTSTNLEHDTDSNAGPFDRAKLERELAKYGKAFGQGQNSRPAAAQMCVDAASRLKDVGPNDADKLYSKFAAAAAASQGIEYSASASHKVQVSKLKRFLMLGSLPAIDGVDVFNKAYDSIAELSRRAESPLRGSAYDNLVKVARRQIEQPTVELTKDQIMEILSEQPEDKDDLDRVVDAYKRIYTLNEKLGENGVDHGPVSDALEDLAQQIADMGGELPAMTKEERKVAKAAETLARHGLKPVSMAAMVVQQPAPTADNDVVDTSAIAAE